MHGMKPLDDILNRLQITGETRRQAQDIFRTASHLTRPGSAYALTTGPQVLPAACLFIASSRLGNTDVTKEVARHAACVDLKTFEKVQSFVEKALLSNTSPTKSKKNILTYLTLVQQYHGREDAHIPMVEVEKAVSQSQEDADTSTPLFQGAIFSWVYINVFKLNVPGEEFVRQQVHASLREWSLARRIITKCCSSMKDTLIAQAETALSRTARSSRSRPSLLPIASSLSVTPSKTPQITPSTGSASTGRVTAIKRKPAVINIIEEISSPSKRAKTALYPSSIHNNSETPKFLTSHSLKEASQASKGIADKVSALDGDDSEVDIPNETIVIPREPTTVVHVVDNRESDPFSRTILAVSGKLPFDRPAYETPRKKGVKIVETPMTTTGGMSDASTPSFTSSSTEKLKSAQSYHRTRAQSFPALRMKRLPLIDEEEESTRRQRRNLRAAFLDLEVYKWKPSSVVSRRLKLAESWEEKFIKNFGDPWDELSKIRGEEDA